MYFAEAIKPYLCVYSIHIKLWVVNVCLYCIYSMHLKEGVHRQLTTNYCTKHLRAKALEGHAGAWYKHELG